MKAFNETMRGNSAITKTAQAAAVSEVTAVASLDRGDMALGLARIIFACPWMDRGAMSLAAV